MIHLKQFYEQDETTNKNLSVPIAVCITSFARVFLQIL